jgi:hypothetical protein
MTAVKKSQVIVLKRPGEKPERVHLGDELNSGAAGSVYSIQNDSARVIKLYHTETLISDGENYSAKIDCMLVNAPTLSTSPPTVGGIVQLAWPTASAHTIHGEFLGFAMPLVDIQRTTELEFILSHKQAAQRGLPHHLGVGVSLAHNLAAVVSSIHAMGHAIVDLKPVNLKFYIQEFYVAVLDCDGFHVKLPGREVSAPQVTPDYLAPEYQNAPITKPEHQDLFALAVIIFKLVNFGIHPYSCVAAKGVQIPSEMEEKIRLGFYSYGLIPHKKAYPVLASTHETFPPELRTLFDRAFGSNPSDRPKAKEWADSLRKFAEKSQGLLEQCSSKHFHFKGMPCATCLREDIVRQVAKQNSAAGQGQARATSPATHQRAPVSGSNYATTTKSSRSQQGASIGAKIGALFTAKNIAYLLVAIATLALIYYIVTTHWITFLVITILMLVGGKDSASSPEELVKTSLISGVVFTGLIFGGIWTYHYLYPENISTTPVQANLKNEVETQANVVLIDEFLAANAIGDLELANQKFLAAVNQFSLIKKIDKSIRSKLLVAALDIAKKNKEQSRLDDFEKVLIGAEKSILTTKASTANLDPSDIQIAIQIHSLLANLYWEQKKFSDVAIVAKRATSPKPFSADADTVAAIASARLVFANSLVLTNKHKSAVNEFLNVNFDSLSDQDRAFARVLQFVANVQVRPQENINKFKSLLGNSAPDEIQNALIRLRDVTQGDSSLVAVRNVADKYLSSGVQSNMDLNTADNIYRSERFGVTFSSVIDESSDASKLVWIFVTKVVPGSPAAKAGIRIDDYVSSINGRSVREMSAVRDALDSSTSNFSFAIEVVREGKKKLINLTP